MEIVSVINYKGGVGKTTVTSNLAAQLAWQGKSVLVLDMDAQASCSGLQTSGSRIAYIRNFGLRLNDNKDFPDSN